MWIQLLLLLVVWLSAVCYGSRQLHGLTTTVAEVVDATVQAEMERQRLVGAVAAVVFPDTRYVQGYGNSSLEEQRPVVADHTLFRWASMGKTMTAIIASDLVLAGKLDLDLDVRNYVPWFPSPTLYYVCPVGNQLCSPFELESKPLPESRRVITMRMLLTHRSGIQHYDNSKFDPTPPAELANDPTVNTGIRWALDYWINEPLIDLPDENYHYSSFAFNLAGVILEEITNTSFAQLMQDRITTPLKLGSLKPDYEWLGSPRRANGYDEFNRNVGSDDVSWKLPGGGELSTITDLADYCYGLMGDSFLSQKAKDLLWTPNNNGIGLSFFVTKDSNNVVTAVWHTGSQQKTRTVFSYYIQEGYCISIMTNSEQADINQFLNSLFNAVQGLF